MDLRLETDRHGRLVAHLTDGTVENSVTAAHGEVAGLALLEAIDRARADGFGECFWQESGGMFWWMLRRDAGQLEVVVLWSSGTVTGWQHVVRAMTDADAFCARAAEQIAAQRVSTSSSVPPSS
jgi:hypothetical protein